MEPRLTKLDLENQARAGGDGELLAINNGSPGWRTPEDIGLTTRAESDAYEEYVSNNLVRNNTGQPRMVHLNADELRGYNADNTPYEAADDADLVTKKSLDDALAPKEDTADVDAKLDAKADLVDGFVPSSQLPSYVDDVLIFHSMEELPEVGENGKIYVTENTNLTYRWAGSSYIEISESLALGETQFTAYRGDRGKEAYDHSRLRGNPHGVTANQIGLGSVDNTRDLHKPVSLATQAALNDKVSGSTRLTVSSAEPTAPAIGDLWVDLS